MNTDAKLRDARTILLHHALREDRRLQNIAVSSLLQLHVLYAVR